MRAKAIAGVLASAAIAALPCLPGAALARGTGPSPNGPAGRGGSEGSTSSLLSQELELRGSNGYKIRVTLLNREDLSIEASKIASKKGTFGVVSYELTAPEKSGSDDIDTRIGNLGRIRLRFVGEGLKREKPACKGGERVTETGHYVGSISFRGENGFTKARAHRVKGTVESEMGRTCTPGQFGFAFGQATTKPGKGSDEKLSELLGQEKDEGQLTALLQGGDVTFSAIKSSLTFKKKEIRSTHYFVLAGRKHGRISIGSVVERYEIKGSSFELTDNGDPASEAIVSPAAPFSGSATFRRDSPRSSRWTGDLKIDMPGLGSVPLTGRGAKVTLCISECSEGLFSLPFATERSTDR